MGLLDVGALTLASKPSASTPMDLQGVFTRAAAMIHIDQTETFQQFRFVIDDSLPVMAAGVGTNSTLAVVALTYSLQWPLSLVFTPDVFTRYNNLFRFLLYTKSVQVALHDCWLLLNHRKDLRTVLLLRPLQELRNTMSFFVDHFQNYIQTDVLEVEFHQLIQVYPQDILRPQLQKYIPSHCTLTALAARPDFA